MNNKHVNFKTKLDLQIKFKSADTGLVLQRLEEEEEEEEDDNEEDNEEDKNEGWGGWGQGGPGRQGRDASVNQNFGLLKFVCSTDMVFGLFIYFSCM